MGRKIGRNFGVVKHFHILALFGLTFRQHSSLSNQTCGQCYKASTLINYDSRVASTSNLLVITSLEL